MSEANPGYGPERFPVDEIEATEPDRLPDVIIVAEAACDEDRDDLDTDTEDSDVELADDEPSDHSGQYEV